MKKGIFMDNILINQKVHTFSSSINRLIMKTISLFMSLLLVVFEIGYSEMHSPITNNHHEIISGTESVEFKTVIQPIFQKNCSPCHFPGGKMYASMPFDKAETIISYGAGVAKRFQKKKDGNPVIAFLDKNIMH
jgi:hypothetical protein